LYFINRFVQQDAVVHLQKSIIVALMKILYVVLGIVIVVFIATQVFAIRSQWNIVTYPDQLKKKMKSFEIRKYESSLFTSVKLGSSTYKEGSRK